MNLETATMACDLITRHIRLAKEINDVLQETLALLMKVMGQSLDRASANILLNLLQDNLDDSDEDIFEEESFDIESTPVSSPEKAKEQHHHQKRKHERLYHLAIGQSVFVPTQDGRRLGGGVVQHIRKVTGFDLTRHTETRRGRKGVVIRRVA